jgi:hypothetical protein
MATSITGSVSLVYGTHIHSESFSTTASALTNANEFHDYAAGSGRAYTGTSGVALNVGTIGAAEGLLLIKNDSNYGSLYISMDAGTSWDISIPAKVANLISVGPDHAVNVKVPQATVTANVASVTAAGAIVFDASPAVEVGTAVMTGATNTDLTGSADTNDYLVEIDTATTGTVYELDGVTKKDLTAKYQASSTALLVYNVKYRYTLTEA